MPRTDSDMPDTALPVDPRFVHPYPPVCPEAKQRLYVLPNNGSGGSNGGGNRNKHGGFAFTLFCCFCCCIVLFCIVLYCIVGFSGFLYIRKALLINGENWMFGFGFSVFLFVCFFRRVFCFKTCFFDSSSSRLLGAFLCLPMLFISYFSMQINFIPYLCTLKQRESELNYRYWKYSSQGSAF